MIRENKDRRQYGLISWHTTYWRSIKTKDHKALTDKALPNKARQCVLWKEMLSANDALGQQANRFACFSIRIGVQIVKLREEGCLMAGAEVVSNRSFEIRLMLAFAKPAAHFFRSNMPWFSTLKYMHQESLVDFELMK
jgi:hypothetical protein